MLNMIAQAADQGISFGQIVMWAVAGVVVALTGGKAGAVIQKKRGTGNGTSMNSKLQPGIDFVTPFQCDRNHAMSEKQAKELQELRDSRDQERHTQTMEAIGDLKKGIEVVHSRINELAKNSSKG